MGLLESDERQRLIAILLRLPHIDDPGLRTALVARLPGALRNTIPNRTVAVSFVHELIGIVEGETWEQLATKEWSTFFVIENALDMVRGSQLEGDLQALLDLLKTRAKNRDPAKLPGSVPIQEPDQRPTRSGISLTREQRTQLQEALLRTFPKKSKLMQMVWETFDENLMILAGDTTQAVITLNLITWAEANSKIEELVTAILATSPDNSELQEIITA